MKSKIFKLTLGLALCSITAGIGLSLASVFPNEVDALGTAPKEISVPTSLTLKRNSEQEIRDYYKSLNNLPANELKGTNLAKNLKPILSDGMTYVNYDNVWNTACITERDWTRSPKETIPGYVKGTDDVEGYVNFKSSQANHDNPYLKIMYRNDNGKHNLRMSCKHNPDPGIGGINREHIWCQSRGFKASSGAGGPAGTDIHHLIIADAKVNQQAHNNNPYGIVDTIEIKYENTNEKYIEGNYAGTNKKYSDTVFQPIASDRGDIARACFYMMARYNNLSGKDTITQFESNLLISNDKYTTVNSEISTGSKPINMSYLEYLLKWHKEDPVDDFEIYRNDLIFNNFQHNRNPFIDFPAWADVMFGNSNGTINPKTNKLHAATLDETPTKISVTGINVSPKTISLNIGATANLTAKVQPNDATNQNVNFTSSDNSTVSVDQNGTIHAIKKGTATISVTTQEGGFSDTCIVTVLKDETPITPEVKLNKNSLDLKVGNSEKLIATVTPSSQKLTWSSDNSKVAKVDNAGNITAISVGKANIKVALANNSSIFDTCSVNVTANNITLNKTSRTVDDTPTTFGNVKNGAQYFLTAPLKNNNLVYLDASKVKTTSGKIAATPMTTYSDLDGKVGAFTFENTGTNTFKLKYGSSYLDWNDSTGMLMSSTGLNMKLSSGEVHDVLDANSVQILETTGNKRSIKLSDGNKNDVFGFYSQGGTTYSHVFLYENAYTYDLLLSKLKAMDCTSMKDKTFNDRINYLYSRLTQNEKDYLAIEVITGSDKNTYTAKYAFDYANTEFAKNPNQASLNTLNEQLDNHIYMVSIITTMLLGSVAFIAFKVRKYKHK